jgi:hypothetical protein
MEKSDVNGPNTNPVYALLKEASGDASDVDWNFRWGGEARGARRHSTAGGQGACRRGDPCGGAGPRGLHLFPRAGPYERLARACAAPTSPTRPDQPPPAAGPRGKFVVDKAGNVVKRSAENPSQLEPLIKDLLASA